MYIDTYIHINNCTSKYIHTYACLNSNNSNFFFIGSNMMTVLYQWTSTMNDVNGNVIVTGKGFNTQGSAQYKCVFTGINSTNQSYSYYRVVNTVVNSTTLNCGLAPPFFIVVAGMSSVVLTIFEALSDYQVKNTSTAVILTNSCLDSVQDGDETGILFNFTILHFYVSLSSSLRE